MQKKSIDYTILVVTLGLVAFGLVMVFSASYYTSQDEGGSGTFFLSKQLFGAIVGIVAMALCAFLPIRVFKISLLPILSVVVSCALLVAVLFTNEVNGAKRWLEIGGLPAFQPSELARFSMIYFTAWWMDGHVEDIRSRDPKRFFRAISMPGIITGIIFALIILGSNLSMAGSTLILFLILMIAAGMNMRAVTSISAVGMVGVGLLAVLEPYRFRRLAIFGDPFSKPQGDGYQLVQSLYALGAGGMFGVGLGNSRQKYLHLPYSESDFILSIIGEELGFFGLTLLMAAFWILIWRGLRVAIRAKDGFNMFMAVGITSLVAVQLLINVAVVTSSMPPTGVPLPFISAGSTSLVVFMAAIGLLLNISRDINEI